MLQQKQEQILQKLHLKELFKKQQKQRKISLEIRLLIKEEDNEANKMQEIYVLPETHQQIIDDLRFFQALYQNGISENYVPEKVPKCITKKWIEVHQESGNTND